MFVAGIFVGPLVGLLVGHFLFRSQTLSTWIAGMISALILLVLLLLGVVPLELRFGIAAGYLLGVLLSITPFQLSIDAG